MAGELAATERRFSAIVNKIVDVCRQVEESNLRHYHRIGGYFAEFMQGLASNKYGAATVEQLATQLTEAGVLGNTKDPRRFLYWAKNVFDAYPQIDQLDDLARLGFTVSHAKLLFALADEARGNVQSQMIVDGKIVSVRQLEELIKASGAAMIAQASAAAADKATKAAVTEAEVVTPVRSAGAASASPESEDIDLLEVEAEGNPELATAKGERPERASATGAPTIKERAVSNPLKTLRDMEKAVVRANSGVPDAFIVVRESAQIGFDSDAAHARYLEQLRSLRAAAAAFIEPMMSLMKVIEEEVSASEIKPVE